MTHAVVFDIDGTLLNSSDEDEFLYRQSVESVLGEVQFRQSLADYDYVSDAGILLQVLSDNNVVADSRTIAAIKDEFFVRLEAYVTEVGPFEEVPGAKKLLRRLRQSDSHVFAIATGGWRHTARFKLVTAGFDIDGVPLATSDDAIDRAEIMQNAVNAIGSPIQSITYFGDGSWDMQACRDLGWQFRAVGPELDGILSYDGEFVG